MRAGIQSFLKAAGYSACLALCYATVAEEDANKSVDPLAALLAGTAQEMIRFDWNDPESNNNFLVDKPEDYLKMLTGHEWTVRKESPDYIPKQGEYLIEDWQRIDAKGATIDHFKRPAWNSLVRSECVRVGKIVGYRVCTPKE